MDEEQEHREDDRQDAPWLSIPARSISVVEHPCIVKNIDKGITSLGGPAKLSKGLRSQLETTTNAEGDDEIKKLITVSLRPDDPFAKRLLSTPVRSNNLLLQVTVPKRTGRKRKRGSSGPFLSDDDSRASSNGHTPASTIFKSLQDNASTYKVALAGVVDETHRFRSMPDLQSTASNNATLVGLRDHVLPKKYSKLKDYTLNTASGADTTKSIGPSPEFLQMPIAYNYQFRQNVYVKHTSLGVVNMQKTVAYNAYTIIKPTEEHVPTGPSSNLLPEEFLTPYMQTLVQQIRQELQQRPIITRHLLHNKLGWDKRTVLRQAAVYCGYFFESGPWREALIAWGVDPRKDPRYRQYQTVSFTSYLKVGTSRHAKFFSQHIAKLCSMTPEELETEHTFDGVNVSLTGNLFQFCDITDPLIAKILDTEDIRTTCAPTFQGWYHVGTWAKATVILKDKMNTIIGKQTPDNTIYQRIIEWPEQWDDKEIAATYKEEVMDRQKHEEMRREHDLMYSVRSAARNPKYVFDKMEASTERGNEGAVAEDIGEVEIPEDVTEEPITAEVLLDLDGESEIDERLDEGDGEEDAEEGDEDGTWETDDEDDTAPIPTRSASDGPAPFGGLYRVQ